MRADLHIHTTASDGIFPPEAIVAMAKESALDVIAVTDHDTTSGIDAAKKAAAKMQITFVPGVEISAGGDDEILLNEVQEVSREQYERLLVTYADTSNKIANAYYNRSERVASRGWDVDLENAQAKRDAMLTAAIETQRM